MDTEFTTKQALSADSPFDPHVLSGKSIIVTGGTSGIGEAAVRAFVSLGAFVTVGARSEAGGKALVQELGDDKVKFVRCDIKSWADQLKLFKTAISGSPAHTLDIVFANAGVSGSDDISSESPVNDDGDPVEPKVNIVETNIVALLYTIKLATHYLPLQPTGPGRDRAVLVTGSLAGYVDQPGAPQYAASKFGARGVMRCMRRAGPQHGIRFNLLAPWYIPSKIMSQEVVEKIKAHGVDFALMEDAITAILHILSDSSVNGRAVAAVPRSQAPKGYVDIEDDADKDKTLELWQGMALKASARLG